MRWKRLVLEVELQLVRRRMEEVMLKKITEIVRQAAELMKPENIEVEQKGNDSNYVTTADVNVQNFLK